MTKARAARISASSLDSLAVDMLVAKRDDDGAFVCRCPCCGEPEPSLHLARTDEGELVARCEKGCDSKRVYAAVVARARSLGLMSAVSKTKGRRRPKSASTPDPRENVSQSDPVDAVIVAADATADWQARVNAGDDDGGILALAALSDLDYERVRQEAAEALGCRASILDKLVAQARRAENGEGAEAEERSGSPVFFKDPEPCPEPVDPARLLDELREYFARYAVLPPHGDVKLALWVAHTWIYKSFPHSPRLAITSPERRCGKTLVLQLLQSVSRRALMTAHVTSAALFRLVEKYGPTVLLDEADTFLRDSEELRGMINAGHGRDGMAVRCVPIGEDFDVRAFRAFAPVAIAAIGRLPGTISDRSIILEMKRRMPGEAVDLFRSDRPEERAPLLGRLARFAADFAEKLSGADPDIPLGIHNRAADNWRPLFAIADLAGGAWPDLARAAALAEVASSSDDELGVLLLRDVRGLFDDAGSDELASTAICEKLAAREDRPWPEISRGKPITTRKLAALLGRFGIVPVHRRGGNVYRRDTFADAWARYTPDDPSPTCLPDVKPSNLHTSNGIKGLARFQTFTRGNGREGLSGQQTLDSTGFVKGEGSVDAGPAVKDRGSAHQPAQSFTGRAGKSRTFNLHKSSESNGLGRTPTFTGPSGCEGSRIAENQGNTRAREGMKVCASRGEDPCPSDALVGRVADLLAAGKLGDAERELAAAGVFPGPRTLRDLAAMGDAATIRVELAALLGGGA